MGHNGGPTSATKAAVLVTPAVACAADCSAALLCALGQLLCGLRHQLLHGLTLCLSQGLEGLNSSGVQGHTSSSRGSWGLGAIAVAIAVAVGCRCYSWCGGCSRLVGGLEGADGVNAHASGVVTKALVDLLVVLEVQEDGLKEGLKVLELDTVSKQRGQPCLVAVAAQIHLVAVGAVPHKAQLRHVGPRAAVRAARHAHHEALVLADAHLGHDVADAAVHVGQAALRLCHRQAAQGQRGAGHGAALQLVPLLHVLQPGR
mmetsp:Transcript_36451/g.81120  ORF Transcript_36451/g.81120 Transcript_36451/m.81120 type:complete len:259 (+) Transcript_36451:800-1576(+)